jgi:hypothetical protein
MTKLPTLSRRQRQGVYFYTRAPLHDYYSLPRKYILSAATKACRESNGDVLTKQNFQRDGLIKPTAAVWILLNSATCELAINGISLILSRRREISAANFSIINCGNACVIQFPVMVSSIYSLEPYIRLLAKHQK